MTDSSTHDAFRELVARGLIATQPAPLALARGNVDRKDAARSSWLVTLCAGEKTKLTLGRDLSLLAARHAALAQACPTITAAQLGHVHLSSGDALIEAFFDGQTLESVASDQRLPREIMRQAVTRICESLASTEQTSSDPARAAEWNDWTSQLLALPAWQPADAASLKDILLPALYQRLATGPAATRWTNGDFLPANILLNAKGEARLIDAEFATRTHFFAEDAVRFQTLSPIVHDQPDLFAGLLPEPDLSWHLYFWLRQFQLEIGQNTPEYLARVQTSRLGLIRRLAEQGLDIPLPDWSVPPAIVYHHLEEARWLQEQERTVRISGWCHTPTASMLRGVIALYDGQIVARACPTRRADVQQHFASSPQAGLSGFTLTAAVDRIDAGLTLCAILDQGARLPFLTLTTKDLPRGAPLLDNYTEWAALYDPDPPAPAELPAGPRFSILLPVFNPPLPFLHACIESVLAQHYPDWELLIVDDGSTAPGVAACLVEYRRKDPRLQVRQLDRNSGISRASNAALAMAKGEFVVLLDHDDLLRPHALAEFARELLDRPELDAVYSDEDKITADGRRAAPLLKPGFSPEFLLGVMYIGHALCVRTSLARSTGGFDPTFDGIQDYEFFLRVTERTRRIGHIPRMLYHWRQSPGSSALQGNVKGDMDRKQAMAVQAHLQRRQDRRKLQPLQGHRLRLAASAEYPAGRIGVILAWSGAASAGQSFWDTLTASPVSLFAMADTKVPPAVNVIRLAGPTPRKLLLLAAETGRVDALVLLHTPFLAANPAWLSELATCAALTDSGCVAPLLIAPDKRVLESGWTVTPAGAAPIMRGYDPEGDGHHGSLRCTREVAAVSPLCVAISREHVGRSTLPAESTWWDFCLSLADAGLFNRVCPVAQLTFAGALPESSHAYAGNVPRDTFFNPHFLTRPADYTLATPPEHYLPVASKFIWFPEHLPPARLPDGSMLIRGWIFHHRRKSVSIRASIGGLTWMVSASEPRPDVAQAYPEKTAGSCGFRLSLRVPPGHHRLVIEALAETGETERLWVQPVAVPRWSGLRRFFATDPKSLVSFQMMAAPIQAPQPIRPDKFPSPKGPAQARPKFSIVTPSYNQARFLAETMRSVLEQNAAVDYVVQDGGSTDGSKALIERFASPPSPIRQAQGYGEARPDALRPARRPEDGPAFAQQELRRGKGQEGQAAQPSTFNLQPSTSGAPRLVAWECAPDKGQADAIVRGFAKTSGGADDIMAWINSDDFYLPGALGYVADYFASHPEVDVVYGHRVVVNDESQEIGRWFLPKHDPEVLRLNDFVPQETLFWRRRIWDRAGGIDPSFKFALDWDLLLRFQAAGAKIVRVPWFLACFRVHAAQKTSAQMHDVGQKEITHLRERTLGRPIQAEDLERNPRLLSYLRRSAFIEFLWRWGIRAP